MAEEDRSSEPGQRDAFTERTFGGIPRSRRRPDLLDPSAVIVGGGLGSAPGPYWDAAVDAAHDRIWADVARDVGLLRSEIGPRAGMIGAALAAGDQ